MATRVVAIHGGPPADQTLPAESSVPPEDVRPASKLTQGRGAPVAEIAERLPPVCALANHTLSGHRC